MNRSRNTANAHDAQVIAGIQKHLQTASSLPLAGATFTPADLVKLVQSRIDLAGTVASNAATWHASLEAEKALNTRLLPILRGLRQYVLNAFGAASPVLADFGFAAPKEATKTPEQKAAAAAKAKATRAARHTMGKNQKKGVKGSVDAKLVVAPAAASPPAAAPPGVTPPGPPTAHVP